MEPATALDEVVDLYKRFGDDNYDEEVSQLAHALQSAALATGAGASDALVVAALLHDVGHLIDLRDGDAAEHHETTGARYLGALFPPSVTRPIALHVTAKRYRCAVDETEYGRLSNGSKASLARQGGPLDPAAAARFERVEGFADAVDLRAWDDAAKVPGADVPPLDHYIALLMRVSAPPVDGA